MWRLHLQRPSIQEEKLVSGCRIIQENVGRGKWKIISAPNFAFIHPIVHLTQFTDTLSCNSHLYITCTVQLTALNNLIMTNLPKARTWHRMTNLPKAKTWHRMTNLPKARTRHRTPKLNSTYSVSVLSTTTSRVDISVSNNVWARHQFDDVSSTATVSINDVAWEQKYAEDSFVWVRWCVFVLRNWNFRSRGVKMPKLLRHHCSGESVHITRYCSITSGTIFVGVT